jgi:hypothetical protein
MIVTAVNSFALKDIVAPFLRRAVQQHRSLALRPSGILVDFVACVLPPRFMNQMTMLTNRSAGMEPPRRMKGSDETRKDAASAVWFSFGDRCDWESIADRRELNMLHRGDLQICDISYVFSNLA